MNSLSEIVKQTRSDGIGVGMVIAAAIIVRVWGDEVQAEEILGAAGLRTVDDMRKIEVDAYDVWPLRNVIRRLSGRCQPLAASLANTQHRRA